MLTGMDDPYDTDIPPLPQHDDCPPVRTDAELLLRWRQLMGPWGFQQRSLWVLWFDGDGYQAPVIVPIDDIPDQPEDEFLVNLMYIVTEAAQVAETPGRVTVAMTLSRPGSSRVSDSDRAWAGALHDHALRADVALWPVHLATKGTARPLTLDDGGWARPRSA